MGMVRGLVTHKLGSVRDTFVCDASIKENVCRIKSEFSLDNAKICKMVPTTSSCTEHQIVVPECTICLDMYRDPLTLPACGHSVCSGVRATANREYGLTRQRRLPRVSRSFARDAERFPAELRTFG